MRPCALINAFILSGFSAPFTFVGFLPEKQKEQIELLTELKGYKSALIFYVSCHDVNKTCGYLLNVLGNRKVCIVREISSNALNAPKLLGLKVRYCLFRLPQQKQTPLY